MAEASEEMGDGLGSRVQDSSLGFKVSGHGHRMTDLGDLRPFLARLGLNSKHGGVVVKMRVSVWVP